jgi:TRAP-type mannitol/chloroaromatic compound transport system permease large subunit
MLATTLFLLIVLLAVSVPVAAVMGVLGLALNEFFSAMPLHRAMGEIIWNSSSEYILIAIPMFVMLGEILLRAGIAERVYNAIAQWLSWLPGGLMHANIGASAMFAATSGSSVATAATNPAMCAMSTSSFAPTPCAISANASKSMILG